MDLDKYFLDLSQEIPIKENEEFIFCDRVFPNLLEEFSTDNIVMRKGDHTYHPSKRCDFLVFHSFPESYRSFALLILALVFNKTLSEVKLHLSNPISEIKTICIQNYWCRGMENLGRGFHEIPYVFNYFSSPVQRHPWIYKNIDSFDLPNFILTNLDDSVSKDEDFKKRDVVKGFGNARGSVLLAELLLNMSRSENKTVELDLEGELGFRGVHPGSAEVRFTLPGYMGWPEEFVTV